MGEISWPAQEFCLNEEYGNLPVSWNDSLYIDKTVQIVNSLQLQELEVSVDIFLSDRMTVCTIVH